jgi:hypothetical protein
LVHAVLEVTDLTAPDLTAELTARCAEQLIHNPLPGVAAEALAEALAPVARTPLGPLADDLRLVDIAPVDRLAELEFELPLSGGDQPCRTTALLGEIAPLLRAHLPADDPLACYPDLLADPALADQPLRGYLTGSIDAVLRLPGPRFAVVDYKTNWLGPSGEPLTSAHYAPERLAAAMADAHYPLQALLYGVALHRFLRWRLPDYSPERHLGGSLYLFVRGMCGPATPGSGVFTWAPRPALTVALSDLPPRGGPMTTDLGDPRRAHTAAGLLGAFNQAGVLDAADVHVANRVGRLGGELDEQVLLAAALAVRAARLGSVCVDLAARPPHRARRERRAVGRLRAPVAVTAGMARGVPGRIRRRRRCRGSARAAAAARRRPAVPGALLG